MYHSVGKQSVFTFGLTTCVKVWSYNSVYLQEATSVTLPLLCFALEDRLAFVELSPVTKQLPRVENVQHGSSQTYYSKRDCCVIVYLQFSG